MNFTDYGIDEEDYEDINQTILDDNVLNMSLIIMEGKYCAIGGTICANDPSCHGYYSIK